MILQVFYVFASISGLFGVQAEAGAGSLLSLAKPMRLEASKGPSRLRCCAHSSFHLYAAFFSLVLQLLANTVPWALWLPDTTWFGFLLLIVLSLTIEESTLGLAWTLNLNFCAG